ncbi:uncharacterized protein [Oscarella lobularis]|uniref:uncharacterized protein n=1 Tax=Oscarella lobularis TaxID=121494 RepID=UPI0033132BFF
MKSSTCCLALLFLATLPSRVDARMPTFNWDTVPVFNHMGNESGPFNDAAVRILSRFPLVTFEKSQGIRESSCCAEDKIIAAAKQIKAVNSSVHTIFYLNSVIDFNQYHLHEEFSQRPNLYLRNSSGNIVEIPIGNSTPHYNVFDFSQEEARQLWSAVCISAYKTGYIDGCFADRAGEKNFRDNKLTLEKEAAYRSGHDKVLQDLQKALGDNVLIANNYLLSDVGATMIEAFRSNEESIELLQKAVMQKKLVEVHAGYYDSCENITDTLAAFLIGAGEYSYYACSAAWSVNADWLVWHPEYDKPLGKPLGLAVKEGEVYTRRFASGTTASFDISTNKGDIRWAK